MHWEIETDIYTVLCIKQITNKNALYSTRNCTQCSVVTEIQKRGNTYIYTQLIYSNVPQKRTTLSSNYTPIKVKKKKG